MEMQPLQASRTDSRPRRTWSLAPILFAMLCGLILALAPRAASTTQSPQARAVGSIDNALQALDSQNYGEIRAHLQRARYNLTRESAAQAD